MITEIEIKDKLREWIFKTNGKIKLEELNDETPIIEQRIISSLQIMELLLFIEQLSTKPLNFEKIKEGAFRNVNAIHHHFF